MPRFARLVLVSALVCAVPAMAQDTREPAYRTPAERAFILGQMRLFLGSVQAIASDLAAADMKAVAQEAASRGRGANPLSGMPPGMKAKETSAWGSMMGGARAGFDGMAQAASSGAPVGQVTGMLGETMKNCVACHGAYRLVEE